MDHILDNDIEPLNKLYTSVDNDDGSYEFDEEDGFDLNCSQFFHVK